MLVGITAGLSLGTSMIVARHFGAHDREALTDAVHSAIGMTFISGFLVTILRILLVALSYPVGWIACSLFMYAAYRIIDPLNPKIPG